VFRVHVISLLGTFMVVKHTWSFFIVNYLWKSSCFVQVDRCKLGLDYDELAKTPHSPLHSCTFEQIWNHRCPVAGGRTCKSLSFTSMYIFSFPQPNSCDKCVALSSFLMWVSRILCLPGALWYVLSVIWILMERYAHTHTHTHMWVLMYCHSLLGQ
jgi:hypothetical protein